MPLPVSVAQVVPTCVVEEPEDWEDCADTPVSAVVSHVEPQPFQLKDNRTGQWVAVLASSIRGLQTLAFQYFALRDRARHE